MKKVQDSWASSERTIGKGLVTVFHAEGTRLTKEIHVCHTRMSTYTKKQVYSSLVAGGRGLSVGWRMDG